MSARDQIAGNNLLRALRSEDLAVLEPSLQEWDGTAGTLLYQPGDEIQFVYFPCGPSLVSFAIVLEGGHVVETALVGREGAIGGVVSHGPLPAYARAVVHTSGPFLRLSTTDLTKLETKLPYLRHLFARYAECMLSQVLQSVACNAAHTIEQRTVKWLLAVVDRAGNRDLSLTQEQFASMLGVGRTYVSRVIQSLKRRGILETRRGGVRVRDLRRLKALSCRCNTTLGRYFDHVLAGVYPDDSMRLDEATPKSRSVGLKSKA
jgi:CRP-like cAMP-binding protein